MYVYKNLMKSEPVECVPYSRGFFAAIEYNVIKLSNYYFILYDIK